jgi:hypothetical protein
MSLAEQGMDIKVAAEQLIEDADYADEFVCKICQTHIVGCGPKLTTCSHLFCGDCLQQWFVHHPGNQTWAQRAKTGGAVPCPVCKTSLRKESDIYPVEPHGAGDSALLFRMIQGLRIKCDGRHSATGRCSWTGECGAYLQHLQSGSCGMDCCVESERSNSLIESVIAHAPVIEPSALEDGMKDILMTPATNCSEAPSLEELSTEAVLEEPCSEVESCCELSILEDPPQATTKDPSGLDLNSLVQTLVEIDFKEHEVITSEAIEQVTSPTGVANSNFGSSSVTLSPNVGCEGHACSAVVPQHSDPDAEPLTVKKSNAKNKKSAKKLQCSPAKLMRAPQKQFP